MGISRGHVHDVGGGGGWTAEVGTAVDAKSTHVSRVHIGLTRVLITIVRTGSKGARVTGSLFTPIALRLLKTAREPIASSDVRACW